MDGTIGGESVLRGCVKRKLQDLQDECRTIKRKVPTNIAEAAGLAQKLLYSLDVPVSAERDAAGVFERQ